MLNETAAALLTNFLDGRLGGVIGNTIDQSLFGNNISTTIGQGIEFNIDWMGYYFEGKSLPSALGLMAVLSKKPALDMHTGFFSYTVGDSIDLTSNGKLWDLARDVDKTEFGLNTSAASLTEEEKAQLSLEPYINFIFFFNLFTTAITQILSTVSMVLAETENNQATVEEADQIILIMELVLYLVVPLVNSGAAKLITDIEQTFAFLKKDETDDAKAEAELDALKEQVATQGDQIEDTAAATTANTAAIEAVTTVVEKIQETQSSDDEYQAYLARWHTETSAYEAKKALWDKDNEKYIEKQQAYKKSSLRKAGAVFSSKYQPEKYNPGPEPTKPAPMLEKGKWKPSPIAQNPDPPTAP